MKKKTIGRRVFAIVMALCVIMMYSVTAFAVDGDADGQATCSLTCENVEDGHMHDVDCYAHTWNDGEVTTEATCLEEGVKTYTCTVCEETKTEAIDKTDHAWNEGEVTTEATCSAEGVKTYTCTVEDCGATKTEAVDVTAHKFENGTCIVCQAKEAVYVSATGSDTAAGTEDAPFATLAKAVTVADSGSTIYVLSDITVHECARYYGKNLTITSKDGTYTVTRGDNFATISDNARSWYNPAMIEVQTDGNKASLTINNLILDDANNKMGTIFGQAPITSSLDTVQSAIIETTPTQPVTITLGNGTELRNFGGMSAIRATGPATVVMDSGSKITDTMTITRTKGKATGEVGPAGAVWLQGATLDMKAGSVIDNVNGRAVYVDGGSVIMAGTISNVTSNANMWQGETGAAIHLRNSNTSLTMLDGASINSIKGSKNVAVSVLKNGTVLMNSGAEVSEITGNAAIALSETSSMEMKNGAVIKGIEAQGITANGTDNDNRVTLVLDGELTDVRGNKSPIQANAANITIAKNGNIHDNKVTYGALYLQQRVTAEIYGKINNNDSAQHGGAIATPAHGYVEINMYDGAELKNNTAKENGGAIMLGRTKFNMYGGEISGNYCKLDGGGIFVRRGAIFIMKGGTISNNSSDGIGGGVTYRAENNNEITNPHVELLGGTIENNLMKNESNDVAITNYGNGNTDHYLEISDSVKLGNEAIYFQDENKTITTEKPSIKYENASTTGKNVLKTAAVDKEYITENDSLLATFWAQTGGTKISVKGLNVTEGDKVVLAGVPVDESGYPVADATVKFYAAKVVEIAGTSEETSTLSLLADDAEYAVETKLPSTGANGYDFAIVKANYESEPMTITKAVDKTKITAGESVKYTLTTMVPSTLGNYVEKKVEGGEDATPTATSITSPVDAVPFEGGTFPIVIHDKGKVTPTGEAEVKIDNKIVDEADYTVGTAADGCTLEIGMDLISLMEAGYFKAKETPEITVTYSAAYTTAGTYTNTAWVEYTDGNTDEAETTVTVEAKSEPPVNPPIVDPAGVGTVTYTDGVADEEIFADQIYTGNIGDATPSFVGTPERDGYEFVGWTPEVSPVIVTDSDMYTAVWKILDDDDPSVDPNGGSEGIDDDDDSIDSDAMGNKDDIDADAKGVKTGDTAAMIPWALGFGTAIMLLAGAVALRRREEN